MTGYDNAFFDLLLQVEPPSSAQYQTVFESVMTHPSLTQANEETQQELLLDLDEVATRLKFFLRKLDFGPMNKEIADEIILNIMWPIISYASPEIADSETVIEVLLSGFPAVLSCSTRTQESLLKALSEADDLLERWITGSKNSQTVKDWVGKYKYSPRESSMLRSFTQRLMTLCDTCTHDHGVSSLSKRWHDLSKLTDFLKQQQLVYQHYQTREHEKARDTRHFDGLRLLGKDDKKTGKSQKSLSTSAPLVPVDVSNSLDHFGIPTPNSQRTLESALDRLQIEETSRLLSSVIDTFPCRPCNESAYNPGRARRSFSVNINLAQPSDQSFDPETFVRRIGVWKVLLSAQAVRDMKNLSRSGMSGNLR